MTDEQKQQLRGDMCRAMVGVLGRGYVPDYYESAASEFIQIAEWHIDEAAKAAAAARAKKAKEK